MLTRAIRVFIVDDHPVVRDGVAAQLAKQRDIEIIGVAATGEQAVRECARLTPDVVLLDVRLPDQMAPEVTAGIREAAPGTRILLFTAYPDHLSVAPAFAAGAVGLVVKDASATTLSTAIRGVMHDGHYRSPGRPAPRSAQETGRPTVSITHREYDIVRLVASGLTNIEIAEHLHLSPNTVKAYLRTVMHKLDARNRTQLITNARSRGLL